MSVRSSAWYISYDIRPSKQIERRIVLDSLQAAAIAGVSIHRMPYIGMGGFRFIDFLLANRMLGVEKFISIEHDADIIQRCNFNKPFHGMEIFEGSSEEFIRQRGFPDPAVIWLDYEQAVSSDLKDDMVSLAASVKPGSFVFVTSTGELPKRLRDIRRLEARLEALKEEVFPIGSSLVESDVNVTQFPFTVVKLLISALNSGFLGRSDGTFLPYVRLIYKDSTWMATAGGYFGVRSQLDKVRKSVKDRTPFLKCDDINFIFQVEQFNITDAERRLLDRASIAGKRRRSERALLRKLGLRETIIDQYGDLMRFIPRYFESLI
jgi:hypothetical protein